MVRELAYTGRRLGADEAKAIGLVSSVHPSPEALLAAAMETARLIASKSPLAVAGTKRMLDYARDHTVADGLEYVATWQAGMLLGPDIAEQMRASKEDRAAVFADLLPTKHATTG